MVKIQNASLKYVTTLREIAFQTWPDTYGKILSQEQIAYMLDQMFSFSALTKRWKDGATYLIAKENGFLYGFLDVKISDTEPAIAKLERLYVVPAEQQKGVGKTLLKEAENKMKAAGVQKMVLNVNRKNKAKGFYEKFGYTVTGEEDIDIGNGFLMEDFKMEKHLK